MISDDEILTRLHKLMWMVKDSPYKRYYLKEIHGFESSDDETINAWCDLIKNCRDDVYVRLDWIMESANKLYKYLYDKNRNN